MGCAGSSRTKADGNVQRIRKPKAWKHPQPITRSQLIQLREEFWDTAPHYGGKQGKVNSYTKLHSPLLFLKSFFTVYVEIWDALRAAAEADPTLAQAIVESAGILLHNPDMTLCFDERGNSYSLFHPFLPTTIYVVNLIDHRQVQDTSYQSTF
ncbi:hypothetical protein ACS0TY_018258 [Phlomoides rotata]